MVYQMGGEMSTKQTMLSMYKIVGLGMIQTQDYQPRVHSTQCRVRVIHKLQTLLQWNTIPIVLMRIMIYVLGEQ